MLPTEKHVLAAHKLKAGWLAARAFPTATPRGLQLVADWTMLFRILDGHIEKLGTADEVAAYLQYLLGLFRGDIEDSLQEPLAAGIRDLRQRLVDLRPPGHFTHLADRLEERFSGNVAEARNRERAQIPNFASYLPLCEITTGLHVMFSLAEFLEGFSLPDALREHPNLQELATRASNIVGWANDLFTYEKTIIRGEVHNLVLVLMNEHQLTVADAVADAVALHDNEVHSFLGEVERLPSFGVAAGSVRRHVEMLRCWIRGHLDWAQETGCYQPFDDPDSEHNVRPAGQPATA
jgi:hypothetical protein